LESPLSSANSDHEGSNEIPDFEDGLSTEEDLYTLPTEAHEILLKVENLNHCSAIPGIKGMYSAAKVNGWLSCTMA